MLPLFAQFANLRLALLRDAVNYGDKWGMSPSNIKTWQDKLTKCIAAYTSYAQSTDLAGYQYLAANTGQDSKNGEPFRTLNRYSREMTFLVRDYLQMWPYFDKANHPIVPANPLTREIYCDPFGHPGNGRLIQLPTASNTPAIAPKGPIRGIQVWGDNHLCAVRVAYGDGGGPGGVSDTGRMGTPDGFGSALPPRGGKFPVDPNNQISSVSLRFGLIIDAIGFGFSDGTSSRSFGGSTGVPGGIGYQDHVLSSITFTGWDVGYRCVECAIFGFKFVPPPPLTHQVSDLFLKTIPGLARNTKLTADLQADRAGFWHAMAVRAR